MLEKAIVIEPGYADYSIETSALAPLGVKVEAVNPKTNPERFKTALGEAVIIFVRDFILDRDLIDQMTKTKGIVRYGVGTDTIDIAAARRKGIVVTRVPDYGANVEVADHAVSLFLAVKRRIVSRDKDVRNGAWQIGQDEPIGRIKGSTLGLLGFGRIGQAVKDRLLGFGVNRVIAYDPFISNTNGVELVSLDELASQSDILSLHAPGTAENSKIIDDRFLAQMKKNAIIVNTSRGTLIDESALFKALSENRIFGAGLDVFAKEPPVKNALLTLPNVVASDHNGWYSEATVKNIQSQASEQAIELLTTGTASCRVI